MRWKYSVITGFLSRLKDRFVEYHPARTIEQVVQTAAAIRGCEGLEVIYPQDFADPRKLKELLKASGLGVSAVNLNVKSEDRWRFGSFTSPDPAVRKEAVRYLREAIGHARDLGCALVTSAFLNDGTDYPFELDHVRAFRDALEGVRAAAADNADVRVALEYKASEPMAHCFLGNGGKAAYFAGLTGCDNVGVTVDVGHALQAGEVPAETVSFLGATGRLFYVHVNDNYRNWDWDLVPGTVNLWDFVETVMCLRKVGYDGWLTADVFPRRHDPSAVMERTFQWMDTAIALADRIDEDRLRALQDQGDTLGILDYVRSLIAG